ncbi:uncharacterized protein BdWA1_004090 [Babesia duncani]|uniref:Uncharacterized protein n=1 Tax=Babesia duncani TaxID=323732 RepID=A0AAD9UM96_9APIC|nr:hypothetical protein BdWA1_004090 [Babesia duncani]
MSDGLEKCAMFLIGFNILQMMNVYLDGSEFALKRFEVSSSKVSVFIASVQSVRSLATILGIISAILFILCEHTFGNDSKKSDWNKFGAISSILFLALIAFLQLIFFCKSHGHQYVVRYFWLHVFSGFCIGLIQMYGFKLFGEAGSYYSLGNQITGCFVSILHYTLKKVLISLQLDLNFWLIAIHLFVVFLVAFVTFIVVTVAVVQHGQGGGSTDSATFENFKLGAKAAWAPIIMSVVGLAFLYVIYPVIGPILTVESSRHHTILIWCLLLEATSGITVYLWLEKDTNIKKRWHSESGYHYYFFLWLFFIPYFYFGMTLLWALHHPNASFAKTLRYGVWGGVMSCLYYFSAKFISNIGYGCVHGHAKEGVGSTNGEAVAGYVSTLNVFLANLFLVLFTFLGNAHLSNFFMYTGKLAEGHVFPTSSMNGFRSCWFWFSCASSGAWKNFISLFSLDIKEMLLN